MSVLAGGGSRKAVAPPAWHPLMTGGSDEQRAEALRRAIRLKREATRGARSEGGFPRRPPEVTPLLGDLQRSLWLLHQVDPTSPAYHLVSAFRLSAPVDTNHLEKALNEVLRRHAILRSTFEPVDGEVRQVIHERRSLTVTVLDAADAEQSATVEASRPFDLHSGPLVRMTLVRAPDEVLLVLVMHHIVADERSLEVFWRDFATAYAGADLQHSEAPQYDDFVVARSRRPPSITERDLAFWKERLHPLPEDCTLPFERATAPDGPARGQLMREVLGGELALHVRQWAAREGTTPFAVYAVAFRLLLARYLPEQHVAFATPVTTRDHVDTLDMIGYFLNPMIVAERVDETKSVRLALHEFADALRELRQHAGVPFPELVEHLDPPRTPGRHPLFQVMFVYQRRNPTISLGTSDLDPIELDLGESKFDLTLFVTEDSDGAELGVEYRTDRFDAAYIERMLGHYATLLSGMTSSPEMPCADLPLLTSREANRAHSLGQGEPIESMAPLLVRRILSVASDAPDALAVVSGSVEWTYGQLARAALRVSGHLMERGLGPGDRVGLFVDRSPWMLAGILGSAWAGVAYVPLDPGYPVTRNAAILTDAAVSAVLTTRALESQLPTGGATAVCMDSLSQWPANRDELPSLDPDHAVYVLYTSGSTGRPKGVVVTHGNLTTSTLARFAFYDAPPARFLLLPSVAFDSSVAGIYWTFAAGGALVVPTDGVAADARELAKLVMAEKVTQLLCVPSLYLQLLGFGGDQLTSLQAAIVAGERCPPSLASEHFRCLPSTRLFNEYGPTEATVWATVHELRPGRESGPIPIGRPIPGIRVAVEDTKGRPLPPGMPGEAVVYGPTVARGYWNQPDLTAQRFGTGPGGTRFYRTGDRVYWTEEGHLRFLGREDDQLKLHGFRIEPGDVEAALGEHPNIAEAVVVARSTGTATGVGGVPDDPRRLVAFLRSTQETDVGRWREFVANRLPAYMVPAHFVRVSELPRLPNGKVDRDSLVTRELSAGHERTPSAEPQSDLERTLLALWEGLLGTTGIGVTDNFFELGGHSLLVVEMAAAIGRDFGVEVSPAEVFQHPTLRELAHRVNERRRPGLAGYQHLFPLQPTGSGSPFIVAVPHFFSGMFASRFRGERPVYGLRGVSLRSDGNAGRWRTMADLGRELVAEVRQRFPDRGFVVAGYSFGASMAFETVRLMEQAGVPVERLYLLTPMPLHRAPTSGPVWSRARQAFLVRPWRRVLTELGRVRRVRGLPLTPRMLHADVRAERFRLHARYRPGVIRTPTVFFDPDTPDSSVVEGWRPHFEGPLTVVSIPDPHLGEPRISQAKEAILGALAALEAI